MKKSMRAAVDLNCDIGESYGYQKNTGEEKLFQNITSANIACGFHAGDPVKMMEMVRLCKVYGVQVGAHPGFPDPMGFGRRSMELSSEELQAYLLYQIGALHHISCSVGVPVKHVKLHGALYNVAAQNEEIARTVFKVIESIDQNLILVAPCFSLMHRLAVDQGLRVAAEAFADRAYDKNGRLVSRRIEGAVFSEPQQVLERVKSIIKGELSTIDGDVLKINADTICLHGDTAGSIALADIIRRSLEQWDVAVLPLEQVLLF